MLKLLSAIHFLMVLLLSQIQAEQVESRISKTEYALSKTGEYVIAGTFAPYDFPNASNAFDWVFTMPQGQSYQLQGVAPTSNDVFGWKKVNIPTPKPVWFMIYLDEDVDGDGTTKFDWVLFSANVFNPAAYKLSGVTVNGTFEYSAPLNIKYDISGRNISIISTGEQPAYLFDSIDLKRIAYRDGGSNFRSLSGIVSLTYTENLETYNFINIAADFDGNGKIEPYNVNGLIQQEDITVNAPISAAKALTHGFGFSMPDPNPESKVSIDLYLVASSNPLDEGWDGSVPFNAISRHVRLKVGTENRGELAEAPEGYYGGISSRNGTDRFKTDLQYMPFAPQLNKLDCVPTAFANSIYYLAKKCGFMDLLEPVAEDVTAEDIAGDMKQTKKDDGQPYYDLKVGVLGTDLLAFKNQYVQDRNLPITSTLVGVPQSKAATVQDILDETSQKTDEHNDVEIGLQKYLWNKSTQSLSKVPGGGHLVTATYLDDKWITVNDPENNQETHIQSYKLDMTVTDAKKGARLVGYNELFYKSLSSTTVKPVDISDLTYTHVARNYMTVAVVEKCSASSSSSSSDAIGTSILDEMLAGHKYYPSSGYSFPILMGPDDKVDSIEKKAPRFSRSAGGYTYCAKAKEKIWCSELKITEETANEVSFEVYPASNPTCLHTFRGTLSGNQLSGTFDWCSGTGGTWNAGPLPQFSTWP